MTFRGSVFIATSLDGYISRPDGSIDWLNDAQRLVPPGEDCGYADFMKTVDAIVMGRNTFDQVLSFDPWPYGDTRIVVLSSRPVDIPPARRETVTAWSGDPAAVAARLEGEGLRRAYVDGGVTIQRFLSAGLINDLTITVLPILLGGGRPLFGPLAGDVRLKLESSRAYEFGFVQSKYTALRNE